MRNLLVSIALTTILWSCANRIPPTGGPKDEDPPQLLISAPNNGDKNIKYNFVTLGFNEPVVLDKIKENLIITPRIDFEYKTKYKKNTITLEFEGELQDSTTYTLNFREGVVDITEGNPVENLVLAFSTGPLLDTLEVYGLVIDLMTQEPVEKATVGLYTAKDTTDIFNSPPLYFTNTLEDGSFRFRNIKDGNYRLYAFLDGNKNLTVESDREPYAFLGDTLTVDTVKVLEEPLTLQYLNVDSLKINRVSNSGLYMVLSTNKYVTEEAFRVETTDTLVYKKNDDGKEIKFYNTFPIEDSLEVFAQLKDSTGFLLQDTFYIAYQETTRRPDDFTSTLKSVDTDPVNKLVTGELSFDKPIKRIVKDSIRVQRDSTMYINLSETIGFVANKTNTKYSFSFEMSQTLLDSMTFVRQLPKGQKPDLKNKTKSPKRNYELIFPRGTFYSVESDTSELLKEPLKIKSNENYGTLGGTVKTTKESFIIQLLDKRFNLIDETIGGKNYSFSEIPPGEYKIRILIDTNNNGQWDPGDIRKNIQPEPVFIYMDEKGVNTTAIRANWEVNVDLYF